MQRRLFLVRSAQVAAGVGILRHVAACRRPADTMQSADPAFHGLRDRYFLQILENNPVTATYLGGDGYDPALAGINGRLRDYSPSALGVEAGFLRDIERQLSALDPSRLSSQSAIDYRVMRAQIAFMLHMQDRRYYERAIDTYVAEPFRGVDWQIQQMQSFPGGVLGTLEEWQLVVRRLQTVPAYLERARANLLAGRADGNLPDFRMVQRDGIEGSTSNEVYFRTTLPGLARNYLGNRPFAASMLGQVGTAGALAADAYRAFAGFLQETFNPEDHTDRFAAGEEEYTWRLRNCLQVTRSPAELWEYGAQQVAAYEARLFEVAAQVARQANLKLSFATDASRRESVLAVMNFLAQDAPANDDELFRWYREVGERAVAYGREQQMFDIPEDYRLDVVPTPPVLRSTIDAAYYPAPPFKKSGVGRFYLTPTDNDPGALRLNNRASVADTAVHEGFPGHDWHFKYMTEHADEISNVRWFTPGSVEDSSSMWQDSMTAEGWGLYSEELMAEPVSGRPTGFYTPAELLYEIQGQLLRAVRVRVDVGLHTGRMGFNEAMEYFVEHVQFRPGACASGATGPEDRAACDGALRAIYRYSKWPTQAITYNLGKNEILAMREQAVARRPGEGVRGFHERFMRMGTIPPGFFRDALLAADSTGTGEQAR